VRARQCTRASVASAVFVRLVVSRRRSLARVLDTTRCVS
jgi:hypothetical protein